MLGSGSILAQAYPTKPVRIVVSFPPGGPTDTSTRIVAEELAKSLGQPFVIESKPGAGGNIAAESVARAQPDGHTLLVASSGTFSINPFLFATLPFDPVKDFTPISVMVTTALAIIAPEDGPIATLADLAQRMRSDGKAMNYGTAGIGTLPHILGAMLRAAANGDSAHISYRSTPALLEAIAKGEVQWGIDSPVSVIGPLRAGKLRVLAVSSANPWPGLDGVPPIAQAGYPNLVEHAWFGLAGPAGLPGAITAKLNHTVTDILKRPDVAQRLLNLGLMPKSATEQDFARLMAETRARWGAVVRANNIKVE